MAFEKEKEEIISSILQHFEKHGLEVSPFAVKTSLSDEIWSVWIEQADGLDTRERKFQVLLKDFAAGIPKIPAAELMASEWENPANGFFKGNQGTNYLNEAKLSRFKKKWIGKTVLVPSQGQGRVLDADKREMLTVAVVGSNMVDSLRIHYKKVRKAPWSFHELSKRITELREGKSRRKLAIGFWLCGAFLLGLGANLIWWWLHSGFGVNETVKKLPVWVGPDAREMVHIPSGWFWMGSPEGIGNPDEHPRHKVFLGDFFLDRYPVTEEAFSKFEKATGYVTEVEKAKKPALRRTPGNYGSPNGWNQPMVQITWNDASVYCKWAKGPGGGGRLPTEAEWEMAARGDNEDEYFWGHDPNQGYLYSWFNANSGNVIHPVGEKKPNSNGLYDMVGNVMVWCSDWYSENEYTADPQTDPQGPSNGQEKILRGAAWGSSWADLRVGNRTRAKPDNLLLFNVGCRCAKTP